MTWRTFWVIWFLGVIVGASLSNVTDERLGWLVPLVIFSVGIVSYALRWLWFHTWYTDDNFRLEFTNHLPPENNTEPASLKLLTRGRNELVLIVHPRFGFQVNRINFRFLDASFNSVRGRNVVSVHDIQDGYRAAAAIDLQPDGWNGIDLEYRNPVTLASGECLYFLIVLIGNVPWRGTLSVRAQNGDGLRSVARYAVEFR